MLVSVIVPVYKVEKYIHRCVDSILAQTFTDYEVIIKDGGSKDGSLDFLIKEDASGGFKSSGGIFYERLRFCMSSTVLLFPNKVGNNQKNAGNKPGDRACKTHCPITERF